MYFEKGYTEIVISSTTIFRILKILYYYFVYAKTVKTWISTFSATYNYHLNKRQIEKM